MINDLHTVAETAAYIRDAERLGLSATERDLIVESLSLRPMDGDEVRGSGGVRKLRVAGRGKGKSGGYRVMTAYFGQNVPVYLLAILSKGESSNFSQAEIAGFKSITAAIAKHWKAK